jgi:hypothetical protein
MQILQTFRNFCGSGICSMALNGFVAFHDSNHLNAEGSLLVAEELVRRYPESAEELGVRTP